jgi:hypothetical protein
MGGFLSVWEEASFAIESATPANILRRALGFSGIEPMAALIGWAFRELARATAIPSMLYVELAAVRLGGLLAKCDGVWILCHFFFSETERGL